MRTEDRSAITNYRRINNSSLELVYRGELIQGWNEDFAAWQISGVTGCSLLSALVERSVYTSGAATDKAWGVLKTPQTPLQNSCEIWERIIAGQFYACKNSPRRMANWSPRRLRDTGCLQRLHAWASDAWRSLSQLASRHASFAAPPASGEKDAHVHIGVDAQTGLGTGILGTGSRNIGTATTVTYRAEINRDFLSASSWNTC